MYLIRVHHFDVASNVLCCVIRQLCCLMLYLDQSIHLGRYPLLLLFFYEHLKVCNLFRVNFWRELEHCFMLFIDVAVRMDEGL